MRKLSLLVALLLLVTVGGVYATWTYAEGTATSSHKHMSVNIASLGNTTPVGEVVNVLNSMDVLIDDGGNYVAKAGFSGKMGFVFIPGVGASSDIISNGLHLSFDVKQDTPLKYEGNNIFEIVSDEKTDLGKGTKITEENKNTLCPGTDLSNYVGGFYVEISAEQVAQYVQINNIVLDERAEYDRMQSALVAGGALGVSVYEAE